LRQQPGDQLSLTGEVHVHVAISDFGIAAFESRVAIPGSNVGAK
jgi:hypothetical protein